MKPNFKYLGTVALLCVLLSIRLAHAQQNPYEKYDIYYLSIGSGHYIASGKDRPEAINSARTMVSIFQELGGKGYELLSKKDAENGKTHPVTDNYLRREITRLKNDIIRDQPKNPLIVFYYMGHGVGDKDGNQYIALGNYNFKMQKSFKKDDNDFGLFRISDLAREFNALDTKDDDVEHVLSDKAVEALNKFGDKIRENMQSNKASMEEIAKKYRDKISNGEYNNPMEGMEALKQELQAKGFMIYGKEVADIYKKDICQNRKDDCEQDLANKLNNLDISKLKGKKKHWAEIMVRERERQNKLPEFFKKMQGKDFNNLSDEEKSEFMALYKDSPMMPMFKDPRSMPKIELPDGESTMDMKAIFDNIKILGKVGNSTPQGQGVDQPFTPMTPEQIKREQKEALLQARRELDDVKPILTPTEKHPHVPYLIIIDSCSSGLQGMSDEALETSTNAYNEYVKNRNMNTMKKLPEEQRRMDDTQVNPLPNITNIQGNGDYHKDQGEAIEEQRRMDDTQVNPLPNITNKQGNGDHHKDQLEAIKAQFEQSLKNLPDALKRYQEQAEKRGEYIEAQFEKLPDALKKYYEQAEKKAQAMNVAVLQNYAISTARFSQIWFAEMTGGVFKEHGALFFAADPGEISYAFNQSEATFIKNEDRVGRLAKRFELAVNEASSSERDVSLGEFAQMFSSDRTEGLQQGEADLPKPFTWFKLPDRLSNTIFIKAQ